MRKDNTALKAQDTSNDICVGVITSVSGVKGNVKVRSFTENLDDICHFSYVFDESSKQYKVSLVSKRKDFIIAAIEGISNRNEAETLRNTMLYIKRSELPAVKSDQFYHTDLIGSEAKLEDGGFIGSVKNILNFGAGDIIEIYDVAAERTIYYPFSKQFVVNVNTDAKSLILKPLEEIAATAE
ncbi:MAG: ribosome maturation factor RimM [Rickettsiales bacterium]